MFGHKGNLICFALLINVQHQPLLLNFSLYKNVVFLIVFLIYLSATRKNINTVWINLNIFFTFSPLSAEENPGCSHCLFSLISPRVPNALGALLSGIQTTWWVGLGLRHFHYMLRSVMWFVVQVWSISSVL